MNSKRTKWNKLQVFRRVVQLVSFFALPGFYALVFSELKQIYQSILEGNFYLLQALRKEHQGVGNHRERPDRFHRVGIHGG